MANPFFQFKRFTIFHDRCAMKVTTDACLFGAWSAAEIAKDEFANKRLLDIGAGSGLLSLMVAQKNNLLIDAIEIDDAAAQQAAENISSSPWRDKISIMHADVLNYQFPANHHIIVSNPPFYEQEISSTDSRKNTAHHSHGLMLSDVFALIKKQLDPDGVFYLLLPYKRRKEVNDELAKQQLFVYHKVVVAPSSAHPPFRIMIKGGHQKREAIIEEINIKEDQQNYSEAFIRLLKDYYLYL